MSLRPLIVIRVGRLRSERIGHYLMNTELSVCAAEEAQLSSRKRIHDFYFDVNPVANEQVQRMWGRILTTGPRLLLEPAYLIFRALGLRTFIAEAPAEDRDIHDALVHSTPHLRFTADEIALGRELVSELLASPDLPWVCIHQRDSKYLETNLGEFDWSYHSYRDSPISDYTRAIQELVELGYQVVRMGKVAEEPLRFDHPYVIDYANYHLRSDFLDIFLAANCSFFLSTGSGIDSVATVFRRPQLLVNFPLPFHPLTSLPSHMFIYQHFHDLHTGEPLSLRQLQMRKAWTLFSNEAFRRAGIGLQLNSPQEIADAAIEMAGRLSGTWQPLEDDDKLQADFWHSFPRIPEIHGTAPFRARIGTRFLRGNQHLVMRDRS
jgi:putative glycosyltransferase (TIGR04372 family)